MAATNRTLALLKLIFDNILTTVAELGDFYADFLFSQGFGCAWGTEVSALK